MKAGRRGFFAAAMATFALLLFSAEVSSAFPYCAPGQEPEFQFGFAFLKSQLGDLMGEPLECEHANPENGDTLQQTTTGLSFYRKSTNTPTFTDGWNHWAWTGQGLVYWTGSSVDPPVSADGGTPTPVPTPTPSVEPGLPTPLPPGCAESTDGSSVSCGGLSASCAVSTDGSSVSCGGLSTNCAVSTDGGCVSCGGLSSRCSSSFDGSDVSCGGESSRCSSSFDGSSVSCGGLSSRCSSSFDGGDISCGGLYGN